MKKYYTITRLLTFVAVMFLGIGLTTYAQSSKSQYARKGADQVLNNQSNKGYNAPTNSQRIDLVTKYELDGQPEKAKAANKNSNSATQNRAAGPSTTNQTANRNGERCSTDEAYDRRIQDPSYQEYLKDLTDRVSTSKLGNIPCDAANTVVIPVAVHFDAGYTCDNIQCIIDATQAQIDVINTDFAGTNTDITEFTTGIVGCGAPNVASDGACITFCLANQNHPAASGLSDGDPAITLGEYTGGFGNGGDGAPEWPGYLNIFVVSNLQGGVADGIPGALNGDGVTVGGEVFGGPNFGPCTSGNVLDNGAGINWDLGRTLTHEIGHYLGLYHTFQGGCGDEPQSPFPVTDTPAQSNSSGGCPGTGSCAALATGCTAGEFLQFNFMDYYDDACLVMFSTEQAAAMNTFSNAATWANDVIDTGCSDFSESSLFNCSLLVAFEPADGTAITVCLDDGGVLSFTDGSELATTWTWAFAVTSGDLVLGSATSTMQNPTPAITGGTAGTIDVTLTACDAGGVCDVVTQSYTITAATGAACPDDCNFVLNLTDDFGDGWNGATVEVFQDGVSVGVFGDTFTNGTTDGPYTIPLTDGSTIDIVQTSGGFAGEEGFTLVDPFGFTVATLLDGAPLTQTFTASCSVPTCGDGIQNGNETGIDCGGPDCPSCCGNGVQDADETGLDCGGADCPACPACAAGDTEIINETFDACAIPAGWSVTSTDGGTADITFTAGPADVPGGGIGPPADFAGCIALIDDDANDAIGVGCILTDVIDLTAYLNTILTFDWQHEAVAGGGEFLVQVWDGTMWITVFSADDDSNGNNQTVALDAYANPNFQIQFCYDDEGGFQWGAGIDNVSLCGQPNNVCPVAFVPTDASGDFCAGTSIDLVAPGNPNVTYAWSSSSTDVVIADPTAAVTTATLNTASLCAADAVTISLNAICTIDNSVQFDGVVSTVNVFPLPPADAADLVNYVTITALCDEPVVVLAGCENTITVTPDAANPVFPVSPGDMGDATYEIAFAHAGGPDCCPNVTGTTTDIILDGGFESGAPGSGWTEFSDQPFPVIDPTFPITGFFDAWLGAIATGTTWIQQTVTIPATSVAADLTFNIAAGQCDCAGGDDIAVSINGTIVWSLCNPVAGQVQDETTICGGLTDPGAGIFITPSIDVSAFADGNPYTLEFLSTEITDDGTNTSVFVDDVALVVEEPAGVDPCVGSITTPYECTDVANIPTLSEWGLIVLALLLMTIGSLKMGVASFAGAGTSTIPVGSNFKLPFNNAILRKAFIVTGIMAIIGFAICFGIYGAVFMPDLIGVAIAGPIFAYLAHLLFLLETKKNK